MEILRRLHAIGLADLRERTRTPRFWIVLGVVAAATWFCFPAIDAGRLAVSVDDARGRYSSAWTGMSLGLMYSTLLAWAGFYLVRGTVLRDFDTRVWQLLVATPMTRAGYLVAKWASHMVVFAVVIAAGLAVGVFAQLLRGEDRALDLFELVKPSLVLTLPALSLTAFSAIVFDMVPMLRRTAGNVLYFFVWLVVFGVLTTTLVQGADGGSAEFLSDPGGISLAQNSFANAFAGHVPAIDASNLSIGVGMIEGTPRLFEWTHWSPAPIEVMGRLFWLALGLFASAALAPLLDRAAARTEAAPAAERPGRRLRWLDVVLSPLERGASGTLVAAELRLALRRRSLVWWGVLVVCGIVQFAAPLENAAIAAVIAWMLGIDVHARALLREADTRTDGLVFTAPDAARRLALARLAAAVALSLLAVAPLLLRSLATPTGLAGPVLLVAATVAVVGLAGGALFRSPRPYELAMVLLAYIGIQGAGPLAVATLSPAMLAALGITLVVGVAGLFAAMPRLAAASAR